jgi:hypothetical protein
MAWTVRDLTAGRFKRLNSLKRPDLPLGPPKFPFNGHRDFRSRVHRLWSEVAQTPFGDEVKNDWSYSLIPHTCYHSVERDNFLFLTFTFNSFFRRHRFIDLTGNLDILNHIPIFKDGLWPSLEAELCNMRSYNNM